MQITFWTHTVGSHGYRKCLISLPLKKNKDLSYERDVFFFIFFTVHQIGMGGLWWGAPWGWVGTSFLPQPPFLHASWVYSVEHHMRGLWKTGHMLALSVWESGVRMRKTGWSLSNSTLTETRMPRKTMLQSALASFHIVHFMKGGYPWNDTLLQ